MNDPNVHIQLNDKGELESIDLTTGDIVVIDQTDLPALQYKYTYELGQIICNYVREGKTIKEITRMNKMPSSAIIYRWRNMHPDFKKSLEAARQDRAEYFHDKVFEELKDVVDKDDVPAAKLKIDTYKWAAEKANPKEFGKQVSSGDKGGGNVTIVVNTGIQREEVIELPSEDDRKEIVINNPVE